MKKGLFFTTFCCLVLFASSCGPRLDRGKVQTVQRTISDFHAVNVSTSGNVLITVKEGAPVSLIFKGYADDIKEIETEVADGVLHLHREKGVNFDIEDHVEVEITVSSLSELTISGASDVETEGIIKASEFVLKASGASEVKIAEIRAEKLKVRASGAAEVDIKSGYADYARYHFSGAGDLNAYDIQCREVEASVSGAGDIKLSVSDVLSASVSGAGSVRYKGAPATITKNISGVGSVENAD